MRFACTFLQYYGEMGVHVFRVGIFISLYCFSHYKKEGGFLMRIFLLMEKLYVKKLRR